MAQENKLDLNSPATRILLLIHGLSMADIERLYIAQNNLKVVNGISDVITS